MRIIHIGALCALALSAAAWCASYNVRSAALKECKAAVTAELEAPGPPHFTDSLAVETEDDVFSFSGTVAGHGANAATIHGHYTCSVSKHPHTGAWQAEVTVL